MNDKVSMKKSLIITNEKVIRKTPFAKAHYTPLVPSARWRIPSLLILLCCCIFKLHSNRLHDSSQAVRYAIRL